MQPLKLVPLYHQIYLTLRNEILNGGFARAGDAPIMPMPSENELADRYAVSRVTIRRALKSLESEGLIVRRHGAGTFAAPIPDKPSFVSGAEKHYDDVNALIHDYDQKVLAYERIATPAFLQRKIAGFGERCLHLNVLSKRRGQPVHLNHQYVPQRLGDLLGKRRPRDVSLLLELKRCGITATKTDFELTAVAADLDAANHLEAPAGSPLIATTRISLDAQGEPVEYFAALTRPDQYFYRFQMIEAAGHTALRQVQPV